MLWTRASARWLLALATTAVAQNSIVAFNTTTPDAFALVDFGVENPGDGFTQITSIYPLSESAQIIAQTGGLTGAAVEVTPDNQINLQNHDIALISCDSSDYAGLIGADSLFKTAVEKSVVAIIFYSRQSDGCKLTNAYMGTFDLLYTTVAPSDASAILAKVVANSTLFSIGRPNFVPAPTNSNTTGSNPGAGSTSNAPPTNQTVAMIVLYSVTGIITLIFLGIIITGALRAQRHPERYGPRFGPGRPRQSRARGLARAMLDSLPIVKVGNPEETKHADVELQDSKTTTHIVTTVADEPPSPMPLATGSHADESNDITAAPHVATVSLLPPAATPATTEAQGCSICTEDFEVGQDQRVLPCNHRFHPACVDPWLLNIASTCPLCRIDLRPDQTLSTTGDEVEQGSDAPPANDYFRIIADEQARIARLRAAITTRLTDHRSNRGGRISVAPRASRTGAT